MKKQTWPGGLSKYFIQLILFFFLFPFQSAFAQLPQNREYQRELREYIATLSEDDFVVELSPLRVSNSYFNNDDDIYQAWLVFGEDSYEFPSSKGLRVDPKYFTLDEIESGGKVQMRIGRGEWMSTLTTAFFADWNYKGNPHYDSKAVKLRSFVAAAVDMMMMDQAHEEGDGDRSDFLGGQLTQWAYAYKVAKDILPDEAREAFEDGLIRMFEKLEKWGPTGIHADMDTRAAPGVLYVAESVESEDLSKRAYDYIDTILDRHFKSAGYIDHGGAYDGSYNGISLYHLTWAAYMSDYKPLVEALEKMVKLKSHLMLPDPDGVRNAPHHSNSSSPSSAANDQWGPHFRDAGIAGLVDDVGELALLGSEKIVNRSTMLENMEYRAGLINGSSGREDFDSPISEGPGAWKREHWTETHFNAIALNYKKGHYSKLRSAGEQELKLPFEREDNFVESFDDKFLAAKRDGYGAILFNDRLSWWTGEGDTKELNGFGGGNLSAFWTPGTGTVLLGVARGTRFGGHDLDDWAMWPVHALSGETENGRAFSSALQRHPEATYDLGNNPSMVTMEGNLANSYSDPKNGLQGKVSYNRIFEIEEGGVRVTTSISSNKTNKVNKLFEILPVFLRDESNQSQNAITKIDFYVDGSWRSATKNSETVKRIRLQKFDGEVIIEFSKAVPVRLSTNDFYINQGKRSGAQIRNIMIDILENDGSTVELTDQSIEYKIYNPDFGKAEFNYNDTTSPELTISHSPESPESDQKITLTAEASDQSGLRQIQILVAEEVVKTCEDTSECEVEVGPYEEGTYSYSATATDRNSNSAESEKQELTVSNNDTTSPELTISHSPESPESDQKITLTAEASDQSGLRQIQILVAEEVVKTCEDTSECEVEVGPYEEGTYSYSATATDRNSNSAESEKQELTVSNNDTTSPELTISHSPESPESDQKITLTAEASDQSGLRQIQILVAEEVVKTCEDTSECEVEVGPYEEGTYSYSATATDRNSNSTESEKQELTVSNNDTTSPELTISHSPESPESDQKITLTAEASDQSGLRQIQILVAEEVVKTCEDTSECEVEVGPYEEGTYSYSATATDRNSNSTESEKQELTVSNNDTTSPELTISHSPESPESDQKITLTAEASDQSGLRQIQILVAEEVVKTCEDTSECEVEVGPYEEGTYSYSATATDRNSNSAESEKQELTVSNNDTTSPELTISHSPESPESDQKITLTAEASDQSGLRQIQILVAEEVVKTCEDTSECEVEVGPYEEGTYSYSATATDRNSNSAESEKQELTVSNNDTTSPELTISHSPESPESDQKITLTAEASDQSGLRQIQILVAEEVVKTCEDTSECEVEVGPYEEGTYSYSATATDRNSNSTESEKQELTVSNNDTTPPQVELSHSPQNPLDNQKVTFTAHANDDTGVKEIIIYVDGKVVKECTSITKCEVSNGPFSPSLHTYSAKVIDYSTNEFSTDKKKFHVTAHNNPPVKIKAELQQTQTDLEVKLDRILDPDGDLVNVDYDWRINNESIALVNMSFDLERENTLKNYTKSKNNGSINNKSQMPKWYKEGKKGGALKFDGVNDEVWIPAVPKANKLQEFTVESWMKPDNQNSDEMFILSKTNIQSLSQDSISVFKLSINSDNKIKFEIQLEGNEMFSIQTNRSFPTDEWIYTTVVYDKRELRIYLNGELNISQKVHKPFADNIDADIFIGWNYLNDEIKKPFKGFIDEVKILNIALSQNQIKNHYDQKYGRVSLATTKSGQKWRVAVVANDSKTYAKEVFTNEITTFADSKETLSDQTDKITVYNYPNPFNTSTTISYELPESQNIALKIYDINGRLIETIFEGKETAGKGSKTFYPSSLSSGVYFYQLIGNKNTYTRKMTYAK